MIYLVGGNPDYDARNVVTFIAQYCDDLGVERVNVDAQGVFSLLRGMHTDFPYPEGEDGASVFKKAANFVCYFMAHRPIVTPLPEDVLGCPGRDHAVVWTNAHLALEIAI